MNILDMRTAVVIELLIDFICTGVMVALWRQNCKRFDGLGFWAIDFTFQTTGLLLILLRGAIPDWISISVSNSLIVAGAGLGLLGLERFIGQRSQKTLLLFVLGVAVPIHAYLTYVQPNLTLRSLIIAIVLFGLCGQCAVLLLRHGEKSLRQATRWVAFVFGLYAVVYVLRIILLLYHPSGSSDYFLSGTFEAIFYILMQILFVLLTYSMGLMVNRRLVLAIGLQEEKFSKAFHSAPYAILITRLSDGKIIEVNQSFVSITGYAPGEVLGKTSFELNLWAYEADRAAVVKRLSTQGKIEGLELAFRNKAGGLLSGLLAASPIVIQNETCILSSIEDITERKQAEVERERLVAEREQTLSEMKVLSGLLPICMSCKQIRDDTGYWSQIEIYIRSHSQAEFSHGLCPDCAQKLYPEYEGLPKG